MRLARRR